MRSASDLRARLRSGSGGGRLSGTRAAPVEPRATISGSKKSSSAETAAPSIWPTSISTAARPIASIGWRTVVSGGSVQLMKASRRSRRPRRRPDTDSPARRAARIAPSASGSLAQMIPVTPCPISRVAAACPPSSENLVRSTSSPASGVPGRASGRGLERRPACGATEHGRAARGSARSARGPGRRDGRRPAPSRPRRPWKPAGSRGARRRH